MKKVALLVISAFLLQACSAFKDATQTVNIQCSEPGTILTLNGQTRPCPLQFEARRNRDLSIQAYKEGYVPYQRTIGNHFSKTGVLDVVGGCLVLVPAVGLLTSGAWDLDETDIMIQLMPTTAARVSAVK